MPPANLLFQLVSHLYMRVSMIATTNPALDAWGAMFGDDEVIASAALDPTVASQPCCSRCGAPVTE